MIYLSTPTLDLGGAMRIHDLPTSTAPVYARRTNRTATLDGGAVIDDLGFSYADLTFNYQAQLGADEYEKLQRLVRLYPRLQLSCQQGFFVGVIDFVNPRNADGNVELNFLVQERIDGQGDL